MILLFIFPQLQLQPHVFPQKNKGGSVLPQTCHCDHAKSFLLENDLEPVNTKWLRASKYRCIYINFEATFEKSVPLMNLFCHSNNITYNSPAILFTFIRRANFFTSFLPLSNNIKTPLISYHTESPCDANIISQTDNQKISAANVRYQMFDIRTTYWTSDGKIHPFTTQSSSN